VVNLLLGCAADKGVKATKLGNMITNQEGSESKEGTIQVPGDSKVGIAAVAVEERKTPPFHTMQKKPPFWANVPTLPPHFVGRDALVEQWVKRLTSGSNLTLSADGLPGVGKTALATALAHHRQVLEYFTDGVLWAGLGQQADVMSALGEWAAALRLDESQLVDVEQRKQAIRQAIGQRGLLLVIDDAWQLEAAEAMRCGGPNCVHLLTSRDKGLARQFAGATQVMSVPTLDDDPAFA
jgi:hypothetical protein